jgi:hypothetical protein
MRKKDWTTTQDAWAMYTFLVRHEGKVHDRKFRLYAAP